MESIKDKNYFTLYKGRKMLSDVVILRLVLIFFLVWTHAFAPFNGTWHEIQGLESINYPRWIVGIISAARMPGLVFVSGYLLGYTTIRKSDSLSFSNMVIKKVKRLIVPSIIFSIVYYLMFLDLSQPLLSQGYKVLNGAGHMWFLPMLFWCFCAVWVIEHFHLRFNYVLIALMVLAVLPIPDLPLRFSKTAHFLIYFYIGFSIQRKYFTLNIHKLSWVIIIGMVSAYIGIYIWKYYLEFHPSSFNSILELCSIENPNAVHLLVLKVTLFRFLELILGLLGVGSIYLIARILIIPKFRIPAFLVMLSSYCYGVYLYHQFILMGIYYHSNLTAIIPETFLVWVTLALTIVISLGLTHLTLKTKLGRKYVG